MKQTLILSIVAAILGGCVAVPGDYGYRDGYYGNRGYYNDRGYWYDRDNNWRRYPDRDNVH